MKKFSEMITEDRIIDIKAKSKKDILKELVEVIAKAAQVTDKTDFFDSIVKREKIMSTAIGIGLAVPHVKIDSVKDFVMAIGRSKEGVDFDSIDGKPVHLIIMIGANTEQRDTYLKLLAKISIILKNPAAREEIINAPSKGMILKLLDAD